MDMVTGIEECFLWVLGERKEDSSKEKERKAVY
jgi:hypothetical protein